MRATRSFPASGGGWGLVGGVGGTFLGVLGATFGISMSAERARIAELRATRSQAPAEPAR